ncbi:MAG: cytochrome c [Sulfurovum sp.]|nr:cytochrome c [Sulfurovum sp.]
MKLLWILLPFSLLAQEAFISYAEYGEMLYENPRGVSCLECHGKYGEGKIILEYDDVKGKQVLKGADIRKTTLDKMVYALNTYHKVMPRYYLTDKEIKAIYDYIGLKNSLN